MDGLTKAIKAAGSARVLASRIGVGPMAVSQWKKRGIPADRVLEVVRAVEGEVTPHELRPDMYPDPNWLPDTAAW